MRTRDFLLIATASLVIMLFIPESGSLRGQTPNLSALTGQISSPEEGPMEGVLVSARRVGSTFTVTVVSDKQGRYSFPMARLESGQYSLHIRALGYDMDDPGAVQISPQKAATVDLKLKKTQDLTSQLTNAEWLMSFPGTEPQKAFVLNCSTCHTLERIAKSHHNADEWMTVIQRMGSYFSESSTSRLQRAESWQWSRFGTSEGLRKQAEWLAMINLSAVEKWAYPLKTLPRPTGRATRVVITEYDLPRRDSVPHDLTVDSKGMVWYGDSGWQYLGKLDPKTASVVEYPVPTFKPDSPLGILDLQADKDENLWPALDDQGKIARFDTKTLKFTIWDLPKEDDVEQERNRFLMPFHDDVDGKVWTNTITELHRLDMRSGHIDTFQVFQDVPGGSTEHGMYDVTADAQNNCYFMDIVAAAIGRVDAKTGKVTLYNTPTPNSRPRRGQMDSQDRLWFGEFRGNRIGMFDTRLKRFQEWVAPTPWTAPYGAGADKNGEAWAYGITSDRVERLDPKTGQIIEYLLPQSSNLRDMAIDNSSTKVIFWTPNKNSASIIKVEPLD
jgi:virginiamycin B lyase